jgi:SAM-dependent MidA family methyltransferase
MSDEIKLDRDEAQSDLTLGDLINLQIKAQGPMSLSTYMSLALTHPTKGYYRKSDPLGAHGDFITAPEISQMFGEMIGIWVAQTWQQFNTPQKLHLVELGPGRGTLMADLMRVVGQVPELSGCIDVHLIETNPVLIAKQRANLKSNRVYWHNEINDLADLEGPVLFIANEFFDALPIKQFQRLKDQWHERMVGLKGDMRVWGLSPSSLPEDAFPPAVSSAEEHSIWEASFASQQVMREIAQLLSEKSGAILAIDYGYEHTQTGETLQALKAHKHVDPLATPGDADLTAHVDFEALMSVATAENAKATKLMTQAQYLKAMGIEQRAHALASATPAAAQKIAADLHRLIDNDQMGDLFKVACCYVGPTPPYPFEPQND